MKHRTLSSVSGSAAPADAAGGLCGAGAAKPLPRGGLTDAQRSMRQRVRRQTTPIRAGFPALARYSSTSGDNLIDNACQIIPVIADAFIVPGCGEPHGGRDFSVGQRLIDGQKILRQPKGAAAQRIVQIPTYPISCSGDIRSVIPIFSDHPFQ